MMYSNKLELDELFSNNSNKSNKLRKFDRKFENLSPSPPNWNIKLPFLEVGPKIQLFKKNLIDFVFYHGNMPTPHVSIYSNQRWLVEVVAP